MRVNKKELEKFKDIYLNTKDYYFTSEDGDYQDWDKIGYEYNLEQIEKILKDNLSTYYILEGSSGTWQGHRSIVSGYVYTLQDVLNKMSVDEVEVKWDDEDMCIEVIGRHHDGTNRYCLRKPEWYSKQELKYFIDAEIDNGNQYKEDINEFLREGWECSYSNASKAALIDVLLENDILESYWS